ncbi:MAG: hypothetical protein HDR87_04665 [Bacteroides sp.]|nr:hypothetical protein [Bacteroides sp.]
MKHLLSIILKLLTKYQSPMIDLGLIYFRLKEYANNDSTVNPPDYAVKQLHRLTREYRDLPMGLLGGDMAFLLLLARLIKEEILEKPEGLLHMAYNIIKKNSTYFVNAPIQLDLRDRFYPFGVVMMSLLNTDEDTIERYVLEEQIIFRLCDCEKILTISIPSVYSPTELTAGILHSIGAFAALAEKHGVYPHKAKQIKEMVKMAPFDRTHSYLQDIIMLDLQCSREVSIDPNEVNTETLLNLLNDAGRLSICYDSKEFFLSVFTFCKKLCHDFIGLISNSNCSSSQLVGFALGLDKLLYDD